MVQRTYHHGDLRRALLDAAVAAIIEAGPAAMSLRDLARRAGVSHAGPTHHFRDKPGLLTALATEGYDLLATALTAARAESGSALELGLAYVRFAGCHRAHFQVMFRPDLYRAEDRELVAARERATEALCGAPMNLADTPGVPDAPGAPDAARAPDAPRGDDTPGGDDGPGGAVAAGSAGVAGSAGAAGSPGSLDSGRSDGLSGSDSLGTPTGREDGLAAWTAAHGFAVLWLSGALPLPPSADPADAARRILRRVSRDI